MLPDSYALTPDEIDTGLAAFGRLSELDPKRALQEVSRRSGASQRLWLRHVIRSMARRDLEETFEAIEQLTPDLKQIAGGAIVELMVERVVADEQLTLKVRALNAPFHQSIARTEPRTLWNQAAQQQDFQRRYYRQVDVLRKLARLQPELALAWAEELEKPNYYAGVQDSLFFAWAQIDPNGALLWMERSATSNLSWWAQAFATLAKKDPAAAMSQAASLDEPFASTALSASIRYAYEDQPEELMAQLSQISHPQFKRDAMEVIAKALGEQSVEALGGWFGELNENNQRIALGSVTSQINSFTIDELDVLMSYVANPIQRSNLAISLVSEAANSKDTERAERLIQQFAADNEDDLYQTYGANLALKDIKQATARAQNLSGLAKDHYLAGVVQGMQLDTLGDTNRSSIKDMFELYELIQSEEGKQRADITLLGALERYDPVRAESFAKERGLEVERTPDGSGRSIKRLPTDGT